MKKNEPKHMRIEGIEGVDFYVCPFGAMKAANIMSDLTSFVMPIVGALVPMASNIDVGETAGLSGLSVQSLADDVDLGNEKTAEAIGSALANLQISGAKIELLLRKLLIQEGNVTVSYTDDNGRKKTEIMDADLVDEIFCMDVAGMFVLAAKVAIFNYGSFFKRIAAQFGNRRQGAADPASENTEPSTPISLVSLS